MSTIKATDKEKVTIPRLYDLKRRGEPIVMVTAYDYPSARIADEAGIDCVLVGDSLAMTMLGHPNTLSVTVDEMLVFARAATRACTRALVIADMPYGSYTVNADEAVRTALRFVKEAKAGAVKIEGGVSVAPIVRRLVTAGVPVMGHIGLTPQSLAVMGGFRVQGRTADEARALLDDARAIEEAGAFALVVESVPAPVAAAITRTLQIPTIGIGAGVECDGQVLVWHDLFNLYHEHTAKFVRRYGDAEQLFADGLAAYASDVRARLFPGPEHTYRVPERERAAVDEVISDE